MYPWIYRHLVMPVHQAARGRQVIHHWKQAESRQWWSPQQLKALQLEAFNQLWGNARQHVPFYRQLQQKYGLPNQLSSLVELQQFPLVTRSMMRDQAQDFRHPLHREVLSKSTGGSSGQPLQFHLSATSNDRRTAMMHRGYAWAGYRPGDRAFFLWGGSMGKPLPIWKRWKQTLHRRIENQTFANCALATSDDFRRHHTLLGKAKPKVIVAYTNPLYEWALWIRQEGLTTPRLEAILVGAEKLHPFQRQAIEETFQAPIFETYGSREFMLIASECEQHQGLHISSDNLIVELLDDHGRPTQPGEVGNVVITDLYNDAFPFIRYGTDDMAVAGTQPCACGRGLPILRQIVGRSLDILHTRDGRKIPGEVFPHLIKDLPAIQRFQVEQYSLDQIVLRLQMATHVDGDKIEKELIRDLEAILGEQTKLQIERVAEIPLTAAGKRRVVVNHLRLNTGHDMLM